MTENHEPTGSDQPNAPHALLSVEEAAKALGVSRTTMYGLIRDCEIQTARVGRRRLVPAEEIATYIARATAKAVGLTNEPDTEVQFTAKATPTLATAEEAQPERAQRSRRRPKGTRAP